MTARLSNSAARSTVAIAACTVVVLALSSTRIASTQDTGSNQQLSALDKRIKELEKIAVTEDENAVKLEGHVKELEKIAVAADEDAVKLQGRIAQLEGQVSSLKSQEAADVSSAGSQATKAQGGRPQVLQGSTVKVPFKVVDASGKTILTVDTDGGRPKLVIGGPTSGSVTIGVGQEGAGRLATTNKAGKVGVIMGQNTKGGNSVALFGADAREVEASVGTGPKGGAMRVYPHGGGSAQAELVAASDTGGGAVNVYDLQGEAVGWLEASKRGNGRFTIGRAGKIYVEAGALENGRGFVIAGPDVGGAPPGLVIPYYLEGRMPH
jgi:hypothetical protein